MLVLVMVLRSFCLLLMIRMLVIVVDVGLVSCWVMSLGLILVGLLRVRVM